jgi:MATE family multidrug resistance protein
MPPDSPPPTYRPPSAMDLVRLAVPIFLSRASQTVIGMSDVLLVGKLGPEAIAATATGATNAFTILILPMGLTFIVQSFAAQYFGRGDLVSARRFGWYGLMVALATEALALLTLPVVGPVLDLFPYEAPVRAAMASYLAVRLVSGGAAIGIEALGAYFGGLGRTVPAMVANLVAMVLNVALNVVLIDGLGPVPAMGVTGSALASSIATALAFVGLFAFFLWDGRRVEASALRANELARLLRFGLPSGLNWFFEFLAFFFFVNVVVAGLGTVQLAAWNTIIQLNAASFMPAFGLASAGAVLVGQAIGSDQKDDVPRLVKLTLAFAGAWQGAVGLVYVAAPALLLSAFAHGPEAAAFVAMGSRMLTVSAAWQLFDATVNTLAEALRAAGDTLFPLVARLAVAWGLFVPGSLWLVKAKGGGEVGATVCLVAYLGLLAVILVWRFRSGRWRDVRLVEPTLVEPPDEALRSQA